MTVYTVHEPQPRKNEDATDPDRFVFVRDGFYFWAFLLGPLWMLWRGLWLVLLFYLAAWVGLQAITSVLGLSATANFVIVLLLALLVGFEAGSLQRWTYARRGWANLGLVVAPNIEAAERRFFDVWMVRRSVTASAIAPPPVVTASPATRVAPAAAGVIGLFPEPEPRPRS